MLVADAGGRSGRKPAMLVVFVRDRRNQLLGRQNQMLDSARCRHTFCPSRQPERRSPPLQPLTNVAWKLQPIVSAFHADRAMGWTVGRRPQHHGTGRPSSREPPDLAVLEAELAQAVDVGEPKRLSSVGIDLVGSLNPPEIVCVLIFETANGVYRFEVDMDRAEAIAEDMQRWSPRLAFRTALSPEHHVHELRLRPCSQS